MVADDAIYVRAHARHVQQNTATKAIANRSDFVGFNAWLLF